MRIARHGSDFRSDLDALASQVHPVFMLPPLAASGFGAVLAWRATDTVSGSLPVVLALVHVAAIFSAVYTAHVKDGYVDFYLRAEDDDHSITESGCRLALAGSTVAFFTLLVALWWRIDVLAALLTLPTWVIAYGHAPQLDTNPLTATTGYPMGIALAIVGGYYVQAGAVAPIAAAFAVVFLVLLSGVKVIDDAQDYDYDRSIAKRTVAVAVGPRQARLFAYGLMIAGMLAVAGFAATQLFPPSTVLASLAFALVALATRRAGPELATMLLVRGSYVFLAVLVAAVWFRPLS
ncbi:MAG: UbiA family prenyltransferase [Halobacteriales archaeon]